jgi:bacteriorhodopsin
MNHALERGMEILAAMMVLLILAIAVLPTWPYSPANWGYYPTGVCGFVVVVIAAMIVVGRL